MPKASEQLYAIVAPIVAGLGYELVGVETQSQGASSLLRVYIDVQGGIGIEDCERVSKQLSAVLDVEDPIGEHYVLEVSSPGVDRPLFTLEHFRRFIGERARLRLRSVLQGRRRLTGEIVEVDGNAVIVQESGQVPFTVPLESIERANLIADVG